MKLQSKKSKSSKIAIIIAIVLAVVLLIAGVVILILGSNNNDGTEILSISLSSYPDRIQYYIGEEFDPEGAKIQVFTNDPDSTYFVSAADLVFTGFDSSVAVESQTITISYQGFTTTFNVVVSERPSEPPVLVSIDVPNIQTTYPLDEWNNYGPRLSKLMIVLTYSDGSTREVPLNSREHVEQPKILNAPGTTELVIRYSDGVTTIELPITITITN